MRTIALLFTASIFASPILAAEEPTSGGSGGPWPPLVATGHGTGGGGTFNSDACHAYVTGGHVPAQPGSPGWEGGQFICPAEDEKG